MIVPRSRLLFWVGAVVLPFSVVGALLPELIVLSLLCIAVLALVAVVDASRSLRLLDGLALELPNVVRFSRNRRGAIELRIRNKPQTARRVRLGIAFPREIEPEEEDRFVSLPAGSELSRVEWPCRPLERGNYLLNAAYLESVSPMGFWAVRSAVPVSSEIRVYPNLLTERKHLAALFLNRGTFGLHAQRQIGKGRDFEKLREYIPGDSYDEIHWKATAKRGHPVTKVFQIERTQEVYIVIDASRLSARRAVAATAEEGEVLEESHNNSDSQTTLERFITAALVVGLAAEHQGDLFGVLTFTDKIEDFIRAGSGRAHYHACRDAIYTLEPRTVSPDFDELAAFIRVRLRRRALLIFLTALDDPVLTESFVRNMDLICRQHLVMVNMMKPPGADPLFAGPEVMQVDDLYDRLGGHLRWHKLRETQKVLQRRGVRFSLLENERMSAQLVSQYLEVKQRQML